jgi:hypothetical protein
MFLVPRDVAWLVAFAALCLYPALALPRNVSRNSWWLGTVVSTAVWLVVMIVLMAAADARQALRESAMVFALPVVMFWVVLFVTGGVRIERRYRGRSLESGVRIAALVGGALCAVVIAVPVAPVVITALFEGSSGNTSPNTVFAGIRGEVVGADIQHLTVGRLQGGGPSSYLLTPETRYLFLGSGKYPADPPAGPTWLKPGQPVSVDYVYRNNVAQAQRISIWFDRTGCAGDAKWSAATAAAAAASEPPSLIGSTWEGQRGAPATERGGNPPMIVEFLPKGRLTFRDADTAYKNPNGAWRQDGPAVLLQVNDCYAEYEATIAGDRMSGQFTNERGAREPWTARRLGDVK